jgi:formylglycine-generating enzyme required for sulfatase activity
VFFVCVAALLALSLSSGLAEDPTKGLPMVEKVEHKVYTEKVPNKDPEVKVTFDMVPIPGGVYMMGSPPDEKGRADNEGPQHPVQVKPFWMGKCEVTWEEYDIYWKGDAATKPTPPYADETFGHGREGRPVMCITWHAAMEYCRWLSEKTGKTYRLPTEAEWEWACRAGTTTPCSFGNGKIDDYAWYKENSEDLTHPVGEKKPNPWGLHDMHGNLAEWCLDQYKPNYDDFPKDKISLQPVTLPGPDRFPHVARGGSWMDGPEKQRCAARRDSNKKWIKLDPQRPQSIWWLTSAEFVGFRIVRPVEEQKDLQGYKSKVTKQSD